MRIPVHQPEQYAVEQWHLSHPDYDADTDSPHIERWAFHHHAADLPLPPELQLAEAQAQVEHLQAQLDAMRGVLDEADSDRATVVRLAHLVRGLPDPRPLDGA